MKKLSTKEAINSAIIVGIAFVFIAGFSFGYEAARQIWKGFYLYPIIIGIICILFAIYFFRLAMKKRNEENQS
jgi:H+/Cl- antiporter ClcA